MHQAWVTVDWGVAEKPSPPSVRVKFHIDLLLDCTLGLRLGLTFRGHGGQVTVARDTSRFARICWSTGGVYVE